MVNQHYHTVVFQPVVNTDYNFPPLGNNNIRSQVSGKINQYLVKALAYIQYIIRMIQSSGPFIEKYGPVIKEVPKMYHLVKAFNEFKENESQEDNERIEEQGVSYKEPSPTLFI